MNGHRKSDKPVVATKPSNKTGLKPAAEKVEPRGLAEGNSAKQNMFRIQGRQDMQSALERVRKAARMRRFWRYHLRQEPRALIALAGICGGGAQQWAFLLRLDVPSINWKKQRTGEEKCEEYCSRVMYHWVNRAFGMPGDGRRGRGRAL